jgi:hypothetical protein
MPWVDIGVSPLRFLPDFAITFRFSERLGRPLQFQISAGEIESAVAHIKSFYPATNVEGTVFFGQTPHDRTQIGRRGFVSADDFIDRVPAPLLIKPHPLAPDAPIIQRALKRGASLVDENTYALLRSEGVAVATLSSSVGVEAKAFARPASILHSEVLDRNQSGITVLSPFSSMS